MRKLILLLIALTTFMNVSYASFPITDTLQVKQDTIQTEEIKQYHQSLLKMGIDLNSCKCESCRKGISPLVCNSKGELVKVDKKSVSNGNASAMYLLAGLILLVVVIWGVIGLTRAYNCVDNGSDCPQSSAEKPKSGAPVEFLWATILIVISVGVAIKARITQLKNRKNKSK
ncbi:MAG: hypothetical protein HN535_01770 [Flavobacteriales bacterium]|nr:hypothetical protein [Flavobacteriales bacterium]